MRLNLSIKTTFALVVLISAAASSQKLPSYPDNPTSNLPKPEKVKLYNDAPGIIDPALIPLSIPIPSVQCSGVKESGTVTLSFVVDSDGNPRNVFFKKALADSIDLLALQILLASRFQPATLNGAPVAVGRDVEMRLKVCIEQQSGAATEQTRLMSPQDEKFSDWHHAPAEANLAPIHMPDDARADGEHSGSDFTVPILIAHKVYGANGKSGSFAFGTRVDEHGIHHIEKVIKSTNPAILPIAEAMILSCRSTPAMKDGMPVPVHLMEALDLNSQ